MSAIKVLVINNINLNANATATNEVDGKDNLYEHITGEYSYEMILSHTIKMNIRKHSHQNQHEAIKLMSSLKIPMSSLSQFITHNFLQKNGFVKENSSIIRFYVIF